MARGRGKGIQRSKRQFVQLYRNVKRSTAYHGLSCIARAALVEIIDRYNGINNGIIGLSVRELAHELNCSPASAMRALQKLDDAGLARPTKVGAWRGKRATEWRLMWRRCDKSGDLPVNHWDQREAYRPADPGPKPKPQPTSGAERQRRYRERHRNENRNGEFHQRNTKVSPVKHRRYSSFTGETQTPKNPIKRHNSSFISETHVHMYQGEGDSLEDARGGIAEVDPLADYPELPAFLDRRGRKG